MEMMDIVNENDQVLGSTSREEIYAKQHYHRIAHVIIFNNKKEMALQLRSKTISFCPGHWTTAVGGHVQAGETYEDAALREYKEELGTTSKLKFIAKDYYAPPERKKFLGIFETTYNGPFKLEKGKVDKVEYFSLKKIQEMLDSGEKFHPELTFILKKHYGLK